jgi:ectoine hydroxylase
MAERPAPEHLTTEQKTFFEDQGYLVIKGALSATQVTHWLKIVDALDASHRAAHRVDAGAFVEIRNAIACEPKLLDLLDWPAAFPLVAELMGAGIQ